jgi:hypothetical protein
MTTSPCRTCELLDADKNGKRCTDCRKRLAYLARLEQAPECRQDPCYAASCSLPHSLSRQLGHVPQWSAADYMIGFGRR